MIGQARVELARSGRLGYLGGAAHWGTSDRQAREALLGLLARRPTARGPRGWRAGWPSSTRRRRTSARPATCCSGCWPPDQRPGGRRAGGQAGPARPDGGGQAPGPRRAARAAGRRDQRPGRRTAAGRAGAIRADGRGQAPGPRRAARAAGRQTSSEEAARLAGRLAGMAQLDPTAEDKRQARAALLGLLAGQTDGRVAGALADGVVQLARRRRTSARPVGAARAAGRADRRPGGRDAAGQAGPARPDSGGQAPGPRALLGLLAADTNGYRGRQLVARLAQLDPTAEDKRQAREALLGLLAGQTNGGRPHELAARLAQLDPTAEDKRQAREALLWLLAGKTEQRGGRTAGGQAGPARPDSPRSQRTWRARAVRPTAELLSAVRRNSALTSWLAALPSLASLSGSPA